MVGLNPDFQEKTLTDEILVKKLERGHYSQLRRGEIDDYMRYPGLYLLYDDQISVEMDKLRILIGISGCVLMAEVRVLYAITEAFEACLSG